MGYEMKITGETTSNSFGTSIALGDLNNDGKDDLIVGAREYNSNQGRVYIFYNDGNYPTKAGRADVTLTGEAGTNFGGALTVGDFNADGKADLAVGAISYSSGTGRAYVFYGGNMVNEPATNADIILTGEVSNSYFGTKLVTGDLNADGRDDLIVSADTHNSWTGRVYVFYGGSIVTENASAADVLLTGQQTINYFGSALTVGDFNFDGKDDLAVGAYQYTSQGRAYIFYGGSMVSENASGADIILTGGSFNDYFGRSLTTGDLNTDGKDDLVVGAPGYNTLQGRTYIFYGGSMISEGAAGADVTITGDALSQFGSILSIGDLNADGRDDLVASAPIYSSFNGTGRAYIFYNDGSIPTTAATADVILTGEATDNYYGAALATGDLNADGRDDLLVGAYGYNSSQGRLYFYTTNDFQVTGVTVNGYMGSDFVVGDLNADGKNDLAVGLISYNSNQGRVYIFYGGSYKTETISGADITLTGGATGNYFGISLAVGDWNADGKTDLVVGADGYNSNQGRAYIFYGGSMISEGTAGADVTLTGEATTNSFGYSFAAGDWNTDGKTDLAVGAGGYNSSQGRAYIFYGGSMASEGAAGADVIFTGETTSNSFGFFLNAGDWNADGKADLAVASTWYNSYQGRVYIFYGGSMASEGAAGADVTLTGEAASNYFGSLLTSGDVNADGKVDLVVGAWGYNSNQGRSYIFYGGSMASEGAAGADVTLTGEAASNSFGNALTTGDFNADGKDDIAVGAYNYSTATGRAYIFYSGRLQTESAQYADVIITGEKTSSNFGIALTAGDLSGKGVDDLVIGASAYDTSGSNNEGRVYILSSEAATVKYSQFKQTGTMKIKGNVEFR
jgi:hypothetical protein